MHYILFGEKLSVPFLGKVVQRFNGPLVQTVLLLVHNSLERRGYWCFSKQTRKKTLVHTYLHEPTYMLLGKNMSLQKPAIFFFQTKIKKIILREQGRPTAAIGQ